MPTLVALPGTLLDHRSLALVLSGLPARVELLGSEPTLDAELDRLAALLKQPVVWLGHSLGGIVALHLAARHPQVVAALVLLAANARPGKAASAERRAAMWAEAQQHGLRALARSKLGPGYGVAGDLARVDSLADQAAAVGMARFAHQLAYAAQRPGLLEPPHRLAMPLLALSAGGDALCPPEQSDELARIAPQCQHQCLHLAGHLFPMQQPGWVQHHLHAFLATVPNG